MRTPDADRAVSPVVGVVLMLVVALLLAGTVGAFALTLDTNEDTAESVADGDIGSTATATDASTPEPTLQSDLVVAEDATAGSSGVVHSTLVEVGAEVAGTELDSVLIEYPKEGVDVEGLQHEDVLGLGVDADGDGELETTFDEISGLNINDDNSHVEVTLDSGYSLDEGDRVLFRYDGADNPETAGEYAVSVELNGEQSVDGTLVVS